MKKAKDLNIFAKRLGELIKEHNLVHENIAQAIDVTRQGVGKWVNGESVPDVLTVAKLAKFFGVSVDYLAGNSDVKSADVNIQVICEYTGLSEQAVSGLNKHKNRGYANILSDLLASPYISFLLDDINQVYTLSNAFFNDITDASKNVYDDLTKDLSDLGLLCSKYEAFQEFVESTYFRKENLIFACKAKLEEKIEFPLYKCAKEVEKLIDEIIIYQYEEKIDDVANQVLCILRKENPDNGNNNPKEE